MRKYITTGIWAPFVKRFALYPIGSLSVCPDLSVCDVVVYCGQTVGWIRMPLGTEVGLGPGHPAPPPHGKGHSSPLLTFAIYCIRMFDLMSRLLKAKQSLFVRSITLDPSRLAITGVAIRYDTIRWTILTCAQKLTSSQLSLPHGTKQKRKE